MISALIVTKPNELIDQSKYDMSVKIYERFCNKEDLFCFVPNRDIKSKADNNICFIPFSQQNTWNYKQRAREINYSLNDNCLIIDTNITFPFHQKAKLSFEEELDVLLLTIEFLLKEEIDITLSDKIELSEKQSLYLDKLIEDKKIRLLNE